MYDLNSDEELNGDFGMADHDDNCDTDDKDCIPRAKLKSIKKNNINKLPSLTVKETFLNGNPHQGNQ